MERSKNVELLRQEAETGGDTPEDIHARIDRRLEQSREGATEFQKSIAGHQAKRLEIALLEMMNRTNNNPDIVNKLSEFISGLDHQAQFGDSSKPVAESRQEDVAKFLSQAGQALRWTVGDGNKPAGVKIDFKEWELDTKTPKTKTGQ